MARTKIHVSNEMFLQKYLEYQIKGLSYQDLAVELKLNYLSLYQKYKSLSKQLVAQGIELPKMKLKSGERKGKTNIDSLVEIFNQHLKGSSNQHLNGSVAQNEVKTDGANTVETKTDVVEAGVPKKVKSKTPTVKDKISNVANASVKDKILTGHVVIDHMQYVDA